jgi:hypothetical protein
MSFEGRNNLRLSSNGAKMLLVENIDADFKSGIKLADINFPLIQIFI